MAKGRQKVLPQDAKEDIKKFLILIFSRPAGKKQIEDCKKADDTESITDELFHYHASFLWSMQTIRALLPDDLHVVPLQKTKLRPIFYFIKYFRKYKKGRAFFCLQQRFEEQFYLFKKRNSC